MTIENFITPTPPTPRHPVGGRALWISTLPRPRRRYPRRPRKTLLEAVRAVEAARGVGELTQVGQLADVLRRHRLTLTVAVQDLDGYQARQREAAARDRLAPTFYTDAREVAAREAAIATARARVAAVEGQLADLQPALDATEARVTEARAALEAHRQFAHPAERNALKAAERSEVAAVVQARATLTAAEGDATATERCYTNDSAGWGSLSRPAGRSSKQGFGFSTRSRPGSWRAPPPRPR